MLTMSAEAKSSGSKFKLAEKYPYYLGNKAVFANTKLKVVDKYTDEVRCAPTGTMYNHNLRWASKICCGTTTR